MPQSEANELNSRIELMLAQFGSPDDLYRRYFRLAGRSGCLVYHAVAADADKIQQDILKPILAAKEAAAFEDLLPIVQLDATSDPAAAALLLLQGKCAVVMDGDPVVWLADVRQSNAAASRKPRTNRRSAVRKRRTSRTRALIFR